MAEAYQKQFGAPFDIVMNCDDFDRFTAAEIRRAADPGIISVIYTGSVAIGRWQALVDLCQAAALLQKEGIQIKITAFVSNLPVEAANNLLNIPNLEILPPLAHDQVPMFLKGADILFLPESFDSNWIENIRYSISTKAQLYMMSKRPILVYGPTEAGIVDYALRDNWAYVVSERKQAALVQALRELSTNQSLCAALVQAGVETASRNHDQRIVRRRFLRITQKAAKKSEEDAL